MSFCPNCGKELEGNPLFCPECGAYLMNAANEQQKAPQQESQSTIPPTPPVEQAAFQQAQPVQQSAPQQTPYQPPVQSNQNFNTLPTQQPNQYSGYTDAIPPVQEEKASVGLAILSFFIPLVGLILYFAKKKKQPKTAKACLTAAAISVAISGIMTWFGSKNDDVKKEVINSASDVTVEWTEDGTEAPEPQNAYGSFDDTAYTNEFFGISYTLPNDFAFESYEELAESTGGNTNDDGIPVYEQSGVKFYYDSASFSKTSGSSILTMAVPQEAVLKISHLDEKEFLESVAEGAAENRDNVKLSEVSTISVAGKNCTSIKLDFTSEGVKMSTTYFIISSNGAYFVAQITTNEYDSNTADDYLKYFSTAK